MDIQKEAFESNFKKTEIYRRECAIRGKDILEFSKTMGGYFNIVANDAWNMWQAAKAQAVLEGFVEKTESNTHHYFKLKDWDEWTCIDGIKDAITSDNDINAIVEIDCLEVIEISNKPCFALLAFGKRHGTEVKFFDTKEEAIEAQEPAND
ncbi:hypothetical protein [Acinetobacter sp. ANC 4862]|uniref:hypothetical protein n=1 Tax=Acinetobacter sp. ANC 4862 TaxID=2529849 RepID=UPI00103BEA07|nr:hypothetical protein [Acinetobacter sp. ANC 4862]TCH64245.1 hypothetical protein E0409_06640 [Acinetobacter sp. ANC 4862]